MPITKSAKKALRQNIRRRERNASRKNNYRKIIRAYKKSIAEKKLDEAVKQLRIVYKNLDKAVKSKTIKKNTANRLKSRLSQLIARSSKASS
ncbi:MAG: 30S ribosomal protein S20 [Patescibacteria group bacterium]